MFNNGNSSKNVTGASVVDGTIDIDDFASPLTGDLDIAGSVTADANILAAYDDTDAIEDSAVDIFIYDTSKDSDGGAWRKRTQATSWYNEAASSTRGSRKEFPSVAVIVAEASKVTIYDGDTPDLDMWMVFTYSGAGTSLFGRGNNLSATGITALNGQLIIGTSDGGTAYGTTTITNFVSDGGKVYFFYTYNQLNGVIDRNNNTQSFHQESSSGIVNVYTNDVAITVLPNAPIDSATGLPIPTIAVATDGGVSVIRDDGNVWDLTHTAASNNKSGHVAFTERGGITWSSRLDGSSYVYMVEKYTLPTADDATVHDAIYANFGQGGSQYGAVKLIGTSPFSYMLQNDVANTQGLSRISKDTTIPNNGSVAYITSDYNTGYMVGDIKGAWLSDTDDTNAVGSELVSNGSSFANYNGYTALSGAGLSVVSSKIHIVGADGSDGTYGTSYAVATTVGATYVFNAVAEASTSWTIRVGSTAGGSNLALGASQTGSGVDDNSLTFVADGTTSYVTVYVYGAGDSGDITSISVRLADADRSVKGNGLAVHGTIYKHRIDYVSSSDTGTEDALVAYSNFSSSNYLEQPYNSDLDFGTGDFSVMGWIKFNADDAYDGLFDRADYTSGSYSGNGFGLETGGSNTIALKSSSTGTIYASSSNPTNKWLMYAAVRHSGIVYVYIDGQLEGSAASTVNFDNASATLILGKRNTVVANQTSLALFRLSATAPSAEQIKDIYNAEKVLFQENAKCTLNGSSDSVTAMSYDDSNDELLVGTSGGLSVFKGLRRVDEESGNFTESAQVNGLRVTESTNE